MTLNLSQTAADLLVRNPDRKYTAKEIAEWIVKTYPEESEEKRQRSIASVRPLKDKAMLVNQIAAEIGAQRASIQKKDPGIKTTDGRPRKYYFTQQSDLEEAVEDETKIVSFDIPLEHNLYPILSEYLKAELRLLPKRINEKRSTNNRGPNGNEWLYPDLVAMENLMAEWDPRVAKCSQQYGDRKAKLWSFEAKRIINQSNVRSAYFQAVSNSSWANFGYLVAAELEEKAKKELRMLASLHGVGFILLNTGNPAESEIAIPARERTDLDWDSINRLAEANKDFSDFVDEVADFCLTGKTKASDWD